jgi:hypothetical protein
MNYLSNTVLTLLLSSTVATNAFSQLVADALDTVEITMYLESGEEHFSFDDSAVPREDHLVDRKYRRNHFKKIDLVYHFFYENRDCFSLRYQKEVKERYWGNIKTFEELDSIFSFAKQTSSFDRKINDCVGDITFYEISMTAVILKVEEIKFRKYRFSRRKYQAAVEYIEVENAIIITILDVSKLGKAN